MVAMKDKLGTPMPTTTTSVGWAWAMCSPYQWTKQVASHWGGTRNGTIVHWPKGIKAKGEVRSQFTHVIDVAPTILEAAGIPEPTFVNGVQQSPMEGTSMIYSFDDGEAPERHDLQYFEMFGNRGIYHKGWSAVTRHSTPWLPTRSCLRSTTTCGSSTTGRATGPRPTTCRRRCPRSSRRCSGCG